jgi:hypothetical protein
MLRQTSICSSCCLVVVGSMFIGMLSSCHVARVVISPALVANWGSVHDVFDQEVKPGCLGAVQVWLHGCWFLRAHAFC